MPLLMHLVASRIEHDEVPLVLGLLDWLTPLMTTAQCIVAVSVVAQAVELAHNRPDLARCLRTHGARILAHAADELVLTRADLESFLCTIQCLATTDDDDERKTHSPTCQPSLRLLPKKMQTTHPRSSAVACVTGDADLV